MPISQLSEPIQRAIMFLPGTYATSLLRNHCMRGALSAMQNEGIPSEVIEILKDGCDANIYFFGDFRSKKIKHAQKGVGRGSLDICGTFFCFFHPFCF